MTALAADEKLCPKLDHRKMAEAMREVHAKACQARTNTQSDQSYMSLESFALHFRHFQYRGF